ncbi:MAG: hypothetical protein AAF423_08980 [Pseudomonadota bacterium]
MARSKLKKSDVAMKVSENSENRKRSLSEFESGDEKFGLREHDEGVAFEVHVLNEISKLEFQIETLTKMEKRNINSILEIRNSNRVLMLLLVVIFSVVVIDLGLPFFL